MAVDMFLKIDGISGESLDNKHKGEIDISSFSFGATQVSNARASGAGAGKVSFQDIHISSPVNVASPKLFQACATGQHFKKAVLTCRKAGGDQGIEFLKLTLTDLLVSSFSNGSNPLDSGFSSLAGEDAFPTDQFSLSFAKIELDYTSQRLPGTVSSADASVDGN
jgi:type VI secretion system secreted protein Hcp